MVAIICFDQVTVVAQEKTLLCNISFSLSAREKAVLCGKSGSGKSTVLKTLMGLHTIKSGAVYLHNQVLTAKTVQAIRSHIAYIGQEPILAADTVREALLLPFSFKAHRHHLPTQAQLIAVLQRFKLDASLLKQDCQRLSGGEKQRVALARGLLLGKSVYLLDEVTSALDQDSKHAVFEVFDDEQFSVLSVAHDADWQARCTSQFELDNGHLTQVGNGNS